MGRFKPTQRQFRFISDEGEVEFEFFPIGEQPEFIEVEGVKYYRQDVKKLKRLNLWPMKSDAAGCHPDQRHEFMANAESLGVPTEFDKDGYAIFRSRSHRKAYCEATGHYDRNGGYGDPQKR